MATASLPTQLVLSLNPRDPGYFDGSGNPDVEDWISLYERVSLHNHWDPTIMLANIIFYLKDTPRMWFETHETEITSWDLCKIGLLDLFGKPVGRKMLAQKELASRAQTPTESYVAYIQETLSLCKKVEPEMTEEAKVGHILKGITDDGFHLLVI